jgi:hypothetical protein
MFGKASECLRMWPYQYLIDYAAVNLRRAWDALMDLQKTLAVPSAAWQPGQAFQLDPAWLPIVVRLEADGEDAVIAISHGFAAYVALMAVLLLVFFPTALAYIRMLRTQIRDYINSLSQVTDTQQFVRIHQLRGTYRLMITEAVLVFSEFFGGSAAGSDPIRSCRRNLIG